MAIYLNIYEVLELCKMLFPFSTLLQLFTIFFKCVCPSHGRITYTTCKKILISYKTDSLEIKEPERQGRYPLKSCVVTVTER